MELDETKNTGQDSPPTGVTDQSGQASGDEKGSTSGGEPKTFTEEQTQKMVSDALSKQGRDIKTITTERDSFKQELETRKSDVDELQKRIDELEEASVEGDPDRKAELLNKRKAETLLRDARAKLDEAVKKEAQVKADVEAISQTKLEVSVWQIAAKHGVDPVQLKEKVERFKVESEEGIEEVAQMLGTKGEPKPGLKVDSGKTIGGGEDLSGMSSRQAFGSYLKDKK